MPKEKIPMPNLGPGGPTKQGFHLIPSPGHLGCQNVTKLEAKMIALIMLWEAPPRPPDHPIYAGGAPATTTPPHIFCRLPASLFSVFCRILIKWPIDREARYRLKMWWGVGGGSPPPRSMGAGAPPGTLVVYIIWVPD